MGSGSGRASWLPPGGILVGARVCRCTLPCASHFSCHAPQPEFSRAAPGEGAPGRHSSVGARSYLGLRAEYREVGARLQGGMRSGTRAAHDRAAHHHPRQPSHGCRCRSSSPPSPRPSCESPRSSYESPAAVVAARRKPRPASNPAQRPLPGATPELARAIAP